MSGTGLHTLPHKNPIRKIIYLFYKWENWSPEKLNNLSNGPQLIKVKNSNPDYWSAEKAFLAKNSAAEKGKSFKYLDDDK